ncbi:MAG: NAD-dependent epimerase/dehydratase family protein [Rhodospirillales bacterium]|nr:NAD-dependent epimerase/dehydratase family protein [Rhodospirillales bacterium]
MRIVITGGGGFLGQRLARRLAREGRIGDQPVTELTLFDIVAPPPPDAPFPVRSVAGDVADLPANAMPMGTDIVFHLAAVVSAAAEADYDLGRRVNLRGTDAVVDSCRRLTRPPRVVFTSSVASFSAAPDEVIGPATRQVPANSYGAQKAAAELILADATRRGFLDAVTLRLPTVSIRPGRPNKAASSFVSSILREPLGGEEAELPVADDFRLWITSPAHATDWLLHAATLDTAAMGPDRSVNPPGLTVSVGEMLAALEAAKPGAAALVRRVAAPEIQAIVATWPARFDPARALALGFAAHGPLEALVAEFLAETRGAA